MPGTEEDKHNPAPVIKPNFSAQLQAIIIASITMGSFIHPLETATKRWQKVNLSLLDSTKSVSEFNKAMFQHAHDKSWFARAASFYTGIGIGITYKITVMSYIMMTQKFGADYIQNGPLNAYYQKIFGEQYAGIAANASAGALVGAGETLFLPLNTLKTQYMTNRVVREKIQRAGIMDYYRQQEKKCFYKVGWLTTGKNVFGVGAYFGLDAATKFLLGTQEPSSLQIILSSAVAALGYIAITNPFEVIKVRAQAVEGPVSVRNIFFRTLRDETWIAFFRGTSLRLFSKGSKLLLTFSAAGIMMNKLAEQPLSQRVFSFFYKHDPLPKPADETKTPRIHRP